MEVVGDRSSRIQKANSASEILTEEEDGLRRAEYGLIGDENVNEA